MPHADGGRIWMTIATLYLVLGGIVGLVIGLDILLAYLVAGSPY